MYLFDLDGTLTDSNGLWLDVDITFVGRRGKAVTKEYTDFVAHAIFPTAADFTKEYYQLSESPEEIMAEWLALAYDQYANKVPLKPGALALLTRLRQQREPMALVTAAVPELCEAALKRLGIADCFDFILYAQELGLEKGAPDVWQEAARRAETTPEHCVVLDDSPVACRAAKAAGCQVIGVHDALYDASRGEMERLCDQYVGSLEELL